MFNIDTGLETKYKTNSNFLNKNQPRPEPNGYIQLQQKMYGHESGEISFNVTQNLLNRQMQKRMDTSRGENMGQASNRYKRQEEDMKVFVNVLGPKTPEGSKVMLSPVTQGAQSARNNQLPNTLIKKRLKKPESVEQRMRE